MLAFPEMIEPAAKNAGISVPNDLENYDKNDYPHWFIFCQLQLGAPMPHCQAHFENAKVIADIPTENLKTMTVDDFDDAGVVIGYPIP